MRSNEIKLNGATKCIVGFGGTGNTVAKGAVEL
jgi:hypothetical protein